LILGVVALLLSSAPYLAGYAAQTPDRVFGGAVFDLPDYDSHLAKMQQGLRGEWLYRLLFTAEEHDGALLQTFYVALGHFARSTGLSLPLTYHLARVAFGALFFVTAFRFIAAFHPPPAVRRAAFTLVAFSSGLGWLAQMVAPAAEGGISPIDFWLIDANSFFSIMMFPHFTVAMACLLEIFTRLLSQVGATSSASIRAQILALTALSFLLTFVHPYAIAIVIAPAVLFGLVQGLRRRPLSRQGWLLAGATGLGAGPILIYNAAVFTSQPVFRAWSTQNVTPSPPPIYYLLGFGLVLAFALAGLRGFMREQGDRAVFVFSWVAVVCLLIYLPIGIQRRFVEGVHVPLSVMAAYGLSEIAARLPARRRFVAINLLLALASMSNVYMVVGYSVTAATRSPSLFHSSDLVAAIDWLGANSVWTDTVLATEVTGRLIPARIGHRVALGHAIETLNYPERKRDVAAFFATDTADAERKAMLERLGVQYVLRGDAERSLGGFDPARGDYLREVYRSGDVVVYRVVSF
jgi:hypothetical protein